MFWLICPWAACLPACLCFVCCVCYLKQTYTRAHAHHFSTLVFTQHWVENINWRQSVPRLQGLEESLGSESWLSSQEVLFLTTLHKHWTQRKCPRLTISTVNTQTYTYSTAPSLFLSYVSLCPLRQKAIYFPQRYLQNDRVCSPENHIYADLCTLFLNVCSVLALSCKVYFYFVSTFATLIATLLSLEVKQ